MWVPDGTELYTRDDAVGSLSIVSFDSAVSGWSPRDGLFPGVPLTGAAYSQERQDILRDMQALGAPQDIEMGQSPGSVKTTSGLMLLSEEASQKRAPRERGLLHLYESVFTHVLELNWALRKEDATYDVIREGGTYERKAFTGSDLLPGIKVKMAARVGYDQTLYNKEAAGEALQMGLYKLDSPAAVDRILDLMKLPKDVNENSTLQIERAEMVWSDFMKTQVVPAVDATLHDPLAWYAVLGKRWLTDEALQMQQEAGWPALLPRLANWPQKLSQTEQAEAPAKAIYGNIPQEQWGQVQQQGQALVDQAKAAFPPATMTHQQVSATAPPGAPPPPPPAPPAMESFPVPPPQGFLPDALELKIYTMWRRMLPELDAALAAAETAQQHANLIPPSESVDKVVKLEALLRIRAVIEAYRMMAEAKMAPGLGAPPPGGGGGMQPPSGGPGPAPAPGPPGA